MKIGLIPLDERPVNTRLPRQIAAFARAQVDIPPPDLLPRFRTPAPTDSLAAWMHDHAHTWDALAVSVETLVYGGLIPSRLHHTDADTLIALLHTLADLKRRFPALTVYGFNVITRISRHNDSTEEPDYWADYGARLFRLSQLIDMHAHGEPVADELAALRDDIPAAYRADFRERRARNHTVNRAALDLAAQGVLDLLVLSSDDTTRWGLASREKAALDAERQQRGIAERVLMYPGADEVAAVLVARLINAQRTHTPRFSVRYTVPHGESVAAAFEDGPVRQTVERQIAAVGAQIVRADASPDAALLVHPPIDSTTEWPRPYTSAEKIRLADTVNALVDAWLDDTPRLLADVAFPNGGDPALWDALASMGGADALHVYAAWNTAGNSIGTVVAAGALLHDSDDTARRRLLAHRYYEDVVYQTHVRPQIRATHPAPTPETAPALCAAIARAMLAHTPACCGYRLVPDSVRLPWGRTFEIDFELSAG